MAKITRSTIKSFIKNNFNNLYIKTKSRFDCMSDCLESVDDGFNKVSKDENTQYRLGISGAWFVGGGRDIFREYNNNGFKGYEISNSCNRFILAIEE